MKEASKNYFRSRPGGPDDRSFKPGFLSLCCMIHGLKILKKKPLTEQTCSFNPLYCQYFNLSFFVVVHDLSTRISGTKRRVYNRFNDGVKIVIIFHFLFICPKNKRKIGQAIHFLLLSSQFLFAEIVLLVLLASSSILQKISYLHI